MQRGVRVPDTSRLDELAGPLIDARPDANPSVTWGDVSATRHADLLTLSPVGASPRGRDDRRPEGVIARGGRAAPPSDRQRRAQDRAVAHAVAVEWLWITAPRLDLGAEGGTLELKADPHGPIDLDALPERVTVSRRSGGERLRPRRGGPRRTLKSLLQESHLPIAQRSRLPLVFSGVTLLAVGSLWVDESIQVSPGTLRRARLHHES
jgi:tRNA(Ile)-lysidine synthetase-like protein